MLQAYPIPAATGPADSIPSPLTTVEQRLGRVGAKLDRLLEILDRRPTEAKKRENANRDRGGSSP